MDKFVTFLGPLARDTAQRSVEEFYNSCHNSSDGKFCGSGNGGFSSGVQKYLKNQYQMDSETAKGLGLVQDGTKLLIPFKDENGKTTSFKWRDTAVTTGIGRWGPANKNHGLSVYDTKIKTGPLFIVESPSEGLILAAHHQRVIFFDGADSLISRTGVIDKALHSKLAKIVRGNHSILIPDNDERGEVFAKAVEPLVSQRVNPPYPNKDLREYLINGKGDLDKLIGS